MREVSDNAHNPHWSAALVPGLQVEEDAWWKALVEGVLEVLALR